VCVRERACACESDRGRVCEREGDSSRASGKREYVKKRKTVRRVHTYQVFVTATLSSIQNQTVCLNERKTARESLCACA